MAGDESVNVILLSDIRAIFDDMGMDRISSADLASKLGAMEHRPWAEWKNGKPITPRQTAKLLGGFGIVPATIRVGEVTPKGYMRDHFDDAFARYPLADPQHRHNTDKIGASGGSPSATADAVLRSQRSKKPTNDGHCGAVADQDPDSAEEMVAWTA